MPEARQPTNEAPRQQRRINPFAIAGVLGLVLTSITMGILGPQVNRRGNLAVGVPLIELLTQVEEIFYREERAAQSTRGALSRSISQSTVELAMSEQLGPNESPPDLTEVGFAPIRIDESVRIEDVNQTGIAVVYERMQATESDRATDSSGIVLFLSIPFIGNVENLYARDDLGVPASIESGALYVRRISVLRGPDLWSATWRVGSVLRVLVAPNEQLFDMVMELLELSEPKEGHGSRIASGFAFEDLFLEGCEVKYGLWPSLWPLRGNEPNLVLNGVT